MRRARWLERWSVLAVLAVAWMAHAQDVPVEEGETPRAAAESLHVAAPPRALVLVLASDTDAFFPAFAHEIVATALRERGFSTVPPQVAAEALRADGREAEACLAAAACRRAIAESLGAVTLLTLRLAPDASDSRRARASIALGHAPFDALDALGDVEGDALALGEALRGAMSRVDREAAPCRVVVRSELAVEARLGSVPLPSTVGPGSHPLELHAAGRAPWRGTLVCARGEGIEVRVR